MKDKYERSKEEDDDHLYQLDLNDIEDEEDDRLDRPPRESWWDRFVIWSGWGKKS